MVFNHMDVYRQKLLCFVSGIFDEQQFITGAQWTMVLSVTYNQETQSST